MLAEHIGRETTIKVQRGELRLSRWDRVIWDRFLDWCKVRSPDPVEAVSRSIDKLVLKDAEIFRELMRRDMEEEAKAKAEGRAPVLVADKFQATHTQLLDKVVDKVASRLGVNSPEVQAMVWSPSGSAYLLYLLLQRHQPQITEDEGLGIYDELSQSRPQEIQRVFRVAQGFYEGAEKNGSDPAAAA